MNTDSITGTGDELLVETEVPSLGHIFYLPQMLYAQLQKAHRVERQAMHLYAMSDAELAARGYTPETIRDHLLGNYSD